MCGIAGFVDSGATTAAAGNVLARMNAMLRHRGPDAGEVLTRPPVWLGHRRLAVIDLEASRQPMTSADGRHTLVFNGELYNFRELRAELEAAGRVFRTRGDTEVVLQALVHWGEAALQRLRGMFAFAFWDAAKQCLFAARDPLGIKPFHYAWDGRTLVFASELKAVIAHPSVSQDLDLDALGTFLECQYIPGPDTIYRAVRKLPPAHQLLLQDGVLDIRPYWSLDYRDKLGGDDAHLAALLDAELRRSVGSMLVADVPLGAFVSGGIDSSLVAAIMTDVSGRPVESFNLGFVDDTTQSEHRYAERVAAHLGAHHHSLMVTPDDVLGAFENWVDIFDEPFGDQAALPTLLLARLTRRHVTVALTGEGADELFAGYSNYAKRVREERLTRVLGHRRSPLRALVARLPPAWRKDRILRATALPLAERYATIPVLFDQPLHAGLFSAALLAAQRRSIRDYARRFYEECNATAYLERIMNVDLRLWLPDDLLTKVDRATMAFSLEARVPFLDHAFVEFVARLPAHTKQRGNETKFLLKKVAEKYLPKDIVYRGKQGFVMPLSDWLSGGLKTAMHDALGAGGLARRGLFAAGALERVLAEHARGRRNHAGRLWALTVLERWFQRHAPDFKL
jgi:asparagine synthase (glutamine-hydrolysing)